MDSKVLRLIFTLFVGTIVALFIGFGIRTFDPPPVAPDLGGIELRQNPTDEEVATISAAQKAYQGESESYSREVSLISMAAAVVLLGSSLLLERRNPVMANGILLGGLFMLAYGVGRGFASRDTTALFAALGIALGIVLFLGFRRFRPRPSDAGSPTPPHDSDHPEPVGRGDGRP